MGRSLAKLQFPVLKLKWLNGLKARRTNVFGLKEQSGFQFITAPAFFIHDSTS
jgi:hypothetical protein